MIIAYICIYILVFCFGAVLGSFANVLVYRLPRGEDFRRGRSHCMACGHALAAKDLIPVFSRMLLHGRCRYCGAPFSVRYSLVELLTGLLAVACYLAFGYSWLFLAAFALVFGQVVVAFIDLDTMEIPNGLVIYLLLPALALCWLLPDVSWLAHGIGLVAVALPLFLITLVVPNAFGGGDIKLMAVAGLALGWQLILLAFLIGVLTGGGYGVRLLAKDRAARKAHFAFGPFLALGIVIALLCGQSLISWYLSLLV